MLKRACAIILLAGLIACARERTSNRSFDEAINREVTRVERQLSALQQRASDGQKKALAGELAKLKEAARSTDPAVRLYKLRTPFVIASAHDYVAAHQDANRDLLALETLWNQRRSELEHSTARIGETNAIVTGLHQIATNRSEKYFRASLPYAKASSPASGLYYLAEAEGEQQFARFLERLPLMPSHTNVPDATALRASTAQLDAAAVQMISKDPMNSAAIPVNVRIKETSELIERGSLAGATLSLLSARFELQRRGGTTPAVKGATIANDEVSRLWQAMAAAEPDGAARSTAASVIAFYNAMRSPPVTTAVAAAAAPVTVTLVRWPYT